MEIYKIIRTEINKNVKVCVGLVGGKPHIDINYWGYYGADSCFEKEIICTEIYQEIQLDNKKMVSIYTYIDKDDNVVHTWII